MYLSSIKIYCKKVKPVHLRIIAAFVVLFISQKSFGSDSTVNMLKKNIVFASFGGKENFGSVNYERLFSTGKKMHWSYSIGFQPFQLPKQLSIPISVNAFTRGRLHHLELDFTATFFMIKHYRANGRPLKNYNKQFYLSPFVCYRLQGNSGFMLKAGIGPQLLIDPPSDNVLAAKTKVLQPSVFGSVGFSF